TARPSLIWIHTTLGFGSPHKAGTSEAHGSPLGADEVKATKQALGWDPDKSFYLPEDALARFREAVDRGRGQEESWAAARAAWAQANPDLAREWDARIAGHLPDGWDGDLPAFPAGKPVATRSAGGKTLQAIAKRVPWLLGGDADLGGSTKTVIEGGGDFDGRTGAGRNIHFGVREHAMASICNGMGYYGGMRPYCATFFVFSDYMRPAVRLAAMNHLPVVFVWTHDSIGLGEDGPTHEPVEHLASLRAMPGLVVLRPGDAAETAEAWRVAMRRGDGPTGLVLSRQDLPVFDRAGLGAASGVAQGAYVLRDAAGGAPRAILLASGSEVAIAMAAADALTADGVAVRVVSMPSWELFAAQPQVYRDQVLPPSVTARVSIEAGTTFGWERWVGPRGASIGVDRYGASAPAKIIYEKLGLTAAAAAARVKSLL
ncbi:MAG TPA: transketolase C-terminal domain-containing protein, partial [Kofleriaceae bacterium]|nr:transketolase C-terminal domain-containing protein [Kofleriaceae bacterium]